MLRERYYHLLIWCVFLSILIYSAYTAMDVYGKTTESIPRIAYKMRSDLIRTSRFVWGVSAPSSTFAGQVHQESRWNATVCNRIGACGLGQFLKPTASWMAKRHRDLNPAAPLSPTWAMLALARYNLENFRLIGKGPLTQCQKMTLTLASYNAGPSILKRKKWPKETIHYTRRILYELEPIYEAAGWGPGSC